MSDDLLIHGNLEEGVDPEDGVFIEEVDVSDLKITVSNGLFKASSRKGVRYLNTPRYEDYKQANEPGALPLSYKWLGFTVRAVVIVEVS